jgi:uncharacterized protein
VERSWEQAARYFTLAADQGNADAQFNLALCCKSGKGTARNMEATTWHCKLAADHGHRTAQFNTAL